MYHENDMKVHHMNEKLNVFEIQTGKLTIKTILQIITLKVNKIKTIITVHDDVHHLFMTFAENLP